MFSDQTKWITSISDNWYKLYRKTDWTIQSQTIFPMWNNSLRWSTMRNWNKNTILFSTQYQWTNICLQIIKLNRINILPKGSFLLERNSCCYIYNRQQNVGAKRENRNASGGCWQRTGGNSCLCWGDHVCIGEMDRSYFGWTEGKKWRNRYVILRKIVLHYFNKLEVGRASV